ncbi:MAG: Uma2 family endonuclease [Dehalococcoidia bacterium]
MTTSTRLTLEEFLAMPDIDERRLELIDGEVEEKMSPTWDHGELTIVLGELLRRMGRAAAEPRAIIPESDTRAGSSPLPDLAFYRSRRPGAGEWMESPPDLAVEILSPNQIRTTVRAKVDLYRSFGIPVVWVFDLERRSVDIYENRDGDGGRRVTVSGEELVTASTVPGFAHSAESLLTEAGI